MTKTIDKVLMPAGRYWVGDLCYVMTDSQWKEVCELFLDDAATGVFTLTDGTQFALFGTAYGDGLYEDQNGNAYAVDAGVIGCVLAAKVDDESTLGNTHTFRRPFAVGRKCGVIRFGRIAINTDPFDD
jgi:hypothetical protein